MTLSCSLGSVRATTQCRARCRWCVLAATLDSLCFFSHDRTSLSVLSGEPYYVPSLPYFYACRSEPDVCATSQGFRFFRYFFSGSTGATLIKATLSTTVTLSRV